MLLHIINYSVITNADFRTPKKGIARGSALSPLLAAFHLYAVDQAFSACTQLVYVRYLDDFLVFAKTRWHLRKAVKQLNEFFTFYGFEQHPDKTFIGKIDKGFDWMGFFFTAEGCSAVAPRAYANHVIKLRRLYEHARRDTLEQVSLRVAGYQKRWETWVRAWAPGDGLVSRRRGTAMAAEDRQTCVGPPPIMGRTCLTEVRPAISQRLPPPSCYGFIQPAWTHDSFCDGVRCVPVAPQSVS